jgi:hypothetical protein
LNDQGLAAECLRLTQLDGEFHYLEQWEQWLTKWEQAIHLERGDLIQRKQGANSRQTEVYKRLRKVKVASRLVPKLPNRLEGLGLSFLHQIQPYAHLTQFERRNANQCYWCGSSSLLYGHKSKDCTLPHQRCNSLAPGRCVVPIHHNGYHSIIEYPEACPYNGDNKGVPLSGEHAWTSQAQQWKWTRCIRSGQPSVGVGALVRWNWRSGLSDRGWDVTAHRQWGAIHQQFKTWLFLVSNRISTLDRGWWYNSNPVFSFSYDWYSGRLFTCSVPGLLYNYRYDVISIYRLCLRHRAQLSIAYWSIVPCPSASDIRPLPLVVKDDDPLYGYDGLFKPPCILWRALSSTLSSNHTTAQIHSDKRLSTCATRFHDSKLIASER